MTKKARIIIFAIGIVTGLLLTACAGVATGKIDLAGMNNSAVFFSPAVNVAPIPKITVNLDVLTPLQTVDVIKDDWSLDHVKVNVKEEIKEPEPLQVTSAVTVPMQTQSQAQAQNLYGHFCTRDDP